MQYIFFRGCVNPKWTKFHLQFLKERKRVLFEPKLGQLPGIQSSQNRECSHIFSFDPHHNNPVWCGNYCYPHFMNKESLCKEKSPTGWMRKWVLPRNITVECDRACIWVWLGKPKLLTIREKKNPEGERESGRIISKASFIVIINKIFTFSQTHLHTKIFKH